ncbi:MAG: MBG domain-containing protein, partial [Candidatus Omnitrophica bacterium]|nr:MBG domain-containing protein [Candidatus Omnitrophota bacterium]
VTQSIDGFTTTGLVSMTKTAGTATFTGNVNGAGLTMSGLGGTLDLGVSLTHTFTGTWTRTNGTLDCNTSTLNLDGGTSGSSGTFIATSATVDFGGTSAQTIPYTNYNNLSFSGARAANSITIGGTVGVAGTLTNTATFSGGNFVLTGSTITFNGSGPQTIASLTYNNLTLSGSGVKTTTGVIVNGILSMEGTATVSATPTYGVAATLQYKGTSTQTTGPELPATISNLTVNNINGVILSSNPVISNLILINGKFLITVTADAGQVKVYGAVDLALIYTITRGNLVSGDSFTGALSRAAGTNAGSYALNLGDLSAGANYTLTFIPANFAITAKAITVSASAGQSKVYGATDPTFNYTHEALVGTDAFSGNLSRAAGTNAGSYALNLGDLSAGANYTLTFIPANFAITAKAITVSGSFIANDRVYDATISATIKTNNLSLNGIVGSEIVTLTPVLAFSDKDIGIGKPVSLTADSSLGGGDAGNYNLSLIGAPTTIANINSITPGGATWTGTISTDWNDPLNWDIGSVPGVTDTVFIPNIGIKPIFSSDVIVRDMTINTGEMLSTGGHAFTVEGNFKLLGTLNAANSIITVGGNLTTNSPGTILGTNVTLIVNGYLGTMAHPINVDITGVLSIQAGGMHDMVSVALQGTGNFSWQGAIPGFVFVNDSPLDHVGQQNFRSSLTQGGSVLYRSDITFPVPMIAMSVFMPIGQVSVPTAVLAPAVIAPVFVPMSLPVPELPKSSSVGKVKLPVAIPPPVFNDVSSYSLLPKPIPELNGVIPKEILTITDLKPLIFEEAMSAPKVKLRFPEGGNITAIYPMNEYFNAGKPERLFLDITASSLLTQPVTFEAFSNIQPAAYLPAPVTAEVFAGASAFVVLPKPLPEFNGVIPLVTLSRPLFLEEAVGAIKIKMMFPGGGNIISSYGMGMPLGVEKDLWEPRIRKEEKKR